MTWFHWNRTAQWLTHSLQLGGGVVLALLGMLDIGPKEFAYVDSTLDPVNPNLNPLYSSAFAWSGPLVIIAVVYFVVYVGAAVPLWLMHRHHSRSRTRARGETGIFRRRKRSRIDLVEEPRGEAVEMHQRT